MESAEGASHRNEHAERMRTLMEQVREAMLHAIPDEQMVALFHQENDLNRNYSEHGFPKDTERQRIPIDKRPNVVMFDTLPEFASCLRELREESVAQEVLRHENDHASDLEAQGLRTRYGIAFVKRADTGYDPAIRSFVHYAVSGLAPARVDEITLRAAAAPETPSGSDTRMIERSRDRKESGEGS